MKIRQILFYLTCFLFCQNSFCQTDFNRRIEDHLNNFHYDSASVVIQKAIKFSKKNSEEKFDYYIEYSRILKVLSKTDSCFYFLDKAEKFFKEKQNQSKLFYILSIKAEIARSLVKRNSATNYIYEAEKLFDKNTNLEYKYYYLNRRIALLAEYYNNVPDSLNKIIKIGNDILQNQQEIKDKSLIVYTLNEIGFLYFNTNPKRAHEYFLKAYKIAEKHDSKVAFIDVSINLGRYHQQKETNLSKAVYYYNKALIQAKKINNLWQMQQLYNELKNTTTLSKDFETALSYGDSLKGVENQLYEYANSKRYELLENKFIIESKEKELFSTKKNFYLLLTVLFLFFIGLAVLLFYSKKIRTKNEQLSKLNHENSFLLRETNHRVNNNLQLISLLISETMRKKISEENKIDFKKLLSKVETIASLHRHLYLTKNNDKIDLKNYLFEVKNNFKGLAKEKNINIQFVIELVEINPDDAMYFGLLITELIINSVKHAFDKNQEKNIHLFIELDEQNNEIELEYFDNGILSRGKNINPVLVKQLCQQLLVEPTINSESGFNIKFTKKLKCNE